MNLKYSIWGSMLAVSISLLPQSTLALESPSPRAPGESGIVVSTSACAESKPVVNSGASEQVTIPTDRYIDFIIPEIVDGEVITKIGEGCFKGCEVIRSVTIPACITEIEAEAFADCPYLEVIYFADRADAEDLILGENWNGGVSFEFLLEEEKEQKSPTTLEQINPSDSERPSDTPDTSESNKGDDAQEYLTDEEFHRNKADQPAGDANLSDSPSEPASNTQKPAESPSEDTGTEEITIGDDAAGEERPPSEPQHSEPSENTTTEAELDPGADPAVADSSNNTKPV